ncbi:MAG: hypothetical protein MUE46_14305 [Xanthomonadales bacterium]|nr:hypothetical protein [Xanthomonadales bacterium]
MHGQGAEFAQALTEVFDTHGRDAARCEAVRGRAHPAFRVVIVGGGVAADLDIAPHPFPSFPDLEVIVMSMHRVTDRLAIMIVMGTALGLFLHNVSGHAPLHIDSALFTPVIMHLAQGNGLVLDSFTYYLAAAERTFDFHGLFYPWWFGSVLGIDSYAALLVAHGCWIALSVGLAFLVFRRVPGAMDPRFPQGLLAALLALYVGFISVHLQGRPEFVAIPFICAGYFLLMPAELGVKRQLALYSMATLVFLCSPQVGILVFTVIAVALGIRLKWVDFLLQCGLMVVFVTAVTALFLYGLGSDLWTWLQRMWLAGAENPTRDWLRLLVLPGFSSFPVTNLLVLSLLVAAIIALARSQRPLLLVLLLPAGYILLPNANAYVYLGALPCALHYVFRVAEVSRWRALLRVVLLCLCSLQLLAIMRYGVLMMLAHADGRSFQVAQAELQAAIQLEDGDVVAFDWMAPYSYIVFSATRAGHFWVTAESSWYEHGQDALLARYLEIGQRRLKYIVIPERGQWRGAPKPCITHAGKSYHLLLNQWSGRRATLFGMRLGGITPGYYYALYEYRGAVACSTSESVSSGTPDSAVTPGAGLAAR